MHHALLLSTEKSEVVEGVQSRKKTRSRKTGSLSTLHISSKHPLVIPQGHKIINSDNIQTMLPHNVLHKCTKDHHVAFCRVSSLPVKFFVFNSRGVLDIIEEGGHYISQSHHSITTFNQSPVSILPRRPLSVQLLSSSPISIHNPKSCGNNPSSNAPTTTWATVANLGTITPNSSPLQDLSQASRASPTSPSAPPISVRATPVKVMPNSISIMPSSTSPTALELLAVPMEEGVAAASGR